MLKFLLSQDMLGHPLSLNYRGDSEYNTKLGAIISIAVRVIVLAQMVQLGIAMFAMTDPSILSYARPLYESEVNDFGQMNLNEYRFNIGVFFSEGEDADSKIVEIPASVGRVVSYTKDASASDEDVRDYKDHVNCTSLFQWTNIDLTQRVEQVKQAGYCLNPAEATIRGVETYGGQQKTFIKFLPCRGDDNVMNKTATCLTNQELDAWM